MKPIIERLDHFVLTVADIEATCEFYGRILQMETITFAGGRKALTFGQQKINLHQAGQEFEPKAAVAMPGSADLCFITEWKTAETLAHLQAHNVEIIEGPVRKTGALGPIDSFYFRDPDGNLIEISVYL